MTGNPVMLHIHVEEPSMQKALEILLPVILAQHEVVWKVIDHGSKLALLKNIPNRLNGYKIWPTPAPRILVLIDRDDDDCIAIKRSLELRSAQAGLPTKSQPDKSGSFRVVNRLVIEELEAWFLGDVPALSAAYPGVPPSLASRAAFRDPDSIKGGTWEALLRVLQRAGHYAGTTRLPKMETARRVAEKMNPSQNRSRSFQSFRDGLLSLTTLPP